MKLSGSAWRMRLSAGFRASSYGQLRSLRRRVDELDTAVAENRALRPAVKQLVADIESTLVAFEAGAQRSELPAAVDPGQRTDS